MQSQNKLSLDLKALEVTTFEAVSAAPFANTPGDIGAEDPCSLDTCTHSKDSLCTYPPDCV